MPEMVRAFGRAPTARWVGGPQKSAAAGGPAVGEQRPFPPTLGRGREVPATFPEGAAPPAVGPTGGGQRDGPGEEEIFHKPDRRRGVR